PGCGNWHLVDWLRLSLTTCGWRRAYVLYWAGWDYSWSYRPGFFSMADNSSRAPLPCGHCWVWHSYSLPQHRTRRQNAGRSPNYSITKFSTGSAITPTPCTYG